MSKAIDPRAADPLHHAGPVTECDWCSAATSIVWCITKNNQRMPIEAGINEAGNVEIVLPAPGSPAKALALVHAGPPGMVDDWVPYMPHHATCTRNRRGRS